LLAKNVLEDICSLDEAFDTDSAGEIENSGGFGVHSEIAFAVSEVGLEIEFFNSKSLGSTVL